MYLCVCVCVYVYAGTYAYTETNRPACVPCRVGTDIDGPDPINAMHVMDDGMVNRPPRHSERHGEAHSLLIGLATHCSLDALSLSLSLSP